MKHELPITVRVERTCSFCAKPLRKAYGLDLLGRRHCRRMLCRVRFWIRRRRTARRLRQLDKLTRQLRDHPNPNPNPKNPNL